MVTVKFRDQEFQAEPWEDTLHPGFAISTFEEEHDFIEQYWDIQPGQIVIDAGAAYGSYTLPALAMGAYVYALEPESKIVGNLKHNIKLNGFRDCSVLQVGLWDKEESVDVKSYAPHYLMQKTDPVYPMVRLDELTAKLTRLDWVKIDVEGAEVRAIQGGEWTLAVYQPRLIIECHTFIDATIPDQIKTLLPRYRFAEITLHDNVMLVSK